MNEIEVDPVTLADWLDKHEAFLIDVREADEYATELIQGAFSHPLSGFSPSEIVAMAGDQKVVFHCRQGHRSKTALVNFLEKYPDKTAYHLKGGMHAWKKAGFPICIPSFKKDTLV